MDLSSEKKEETYIDNKEYVKVYTLDNLVIRVRMLREILNQKDDDYVRKHPEKMANILIRYGLDAAYINSEYQRLTKGWDDE